MARVAVHPRDGRGEWRSSAEGERTANRPGSSTERALARPSHGRPSGCWGPARRGSRRDHLVNDGAGYFWGPPGGNATRAVRAKPSSPCFVSCFVDPDAESSDGWHAWSSGPGRRLRTRGVDPMHCIPCFMSICAIPSHQSPSESPRSAPPKNTPRDPKGRAKPPSGPNFPSCGLPRILLQRDNPIHDQPISIGLLVETVISHPHRLEP